MFAIITTSIGIVLSFTLFYINHLYRRTRVSITKESTGISFASQVTGKVKNEFQFRFLIGCYGKKSVRLIDAKVSYEIEDGPSLKIGESIQKVSAFTVSKNIDLTEFEIKPNESKPIEFRVVFSQLNLKKGDSLFAIFKFHTSDGKQTSQKVYLTNHLKHGVLNEEELEISPQVFKIKKFRSN
jgi:hypothetical protein